MDLLNEKEKLRSRVNTIIMGLASLCQQCLVTGKALWDGGICRKMGEMEFKIRPWEMLRFRSSKPTQQLGRQAWMRTEADCYSENLLSSWFMAKIPPLGERGTALNYFSYCKMKWAARGAENPGSWAKGGTGQELGTRGKGWYRLHWNFWTRTIFEQLITTGIKGYLNEYGGIWRSNQT